MPHRVHSIALGLAGLAVALPAHAEELRFGVRSEVSWDDNLFSTPEDGPVDPIDDWSLRVTPSMEVEDPDGSFQWDFTYRPAWEGFLDTDDIDGWDHTVQGGFTWRLTPTTWLEVSDEFNRFQSISRFNETIETDFGQIVTESLARRSRFKRNDFEATLSHQLTETQQVALVFQHFLFDFPNQGQDRTTLGTLLSYRRQMTERLALGAFGGWRRQTFEGVAGADDRETDFYNLSGLLEYQFDPTFEISLSAGPSLVDSDPTQGFPAVFMNQPRFPLLDSSFPVVPASCPTTDDGTPYFSQDCDPQPFNSPLVATDLPFTGEGASDETTRVTFFADVSVTKRWEQWALALSYRRQDDTSASFGTSTISDVVNVNLSWRPSPRWAFTLGGAWIRQEQSTESVVPVVLVRPLAMTEFFVAGPNILIVPQGTGEAFAVGTIEADNDFEQTNIVISGNVSYRLTKRIRVFARAFYIDVTRDGIAASAGDFDRFTAGLGVSYEFEPIRF